MTQPVWTATGNPDYQSISTEPYGASWEDSNFAPTQGAFFDKIEALPAEAAALVVSDIAYNESTWNGVGTIAPSKNVTRDKFVLLDAINTSNDAIRTLTAGSGTPVNKIELKSAATGSAAEVNATGTDTNVDLLLGGQGTGLVRKDVYRWKTPITAYATSASIGDGKAELHIPAEMNGMNLVSVSAFVKTAGTTGTEDIQIERIRAGSSVDMLSTKMTIDSGETSTATAATPAVINTSNDDVATGDIIIANIDAVHTTPGIAGDIDLLFRLP